VIRSLAVPLALALLVSGCRLHLAQVTQNRPVRPASYDQIDLGAQSRNDVLAALGPPDEIAYTTTELVFDYTSAFHRGTDTRVFLPSDVLPGFNPLFILSLPRILFDASEEPEAFEPTPMEQGARGALALMFSLVPFTSGEDLLILRGHQLREDRLRVVFDRDALIARRKSLRLATGEYVEESLPDRVLLQAD
jgi:hypothetical protein